MAGNVLENTTTIHFLKPFIEGSWMTKHDGKYYLQYGAPGTEFSGYGDGVYVCDHPLGLLLINRTIPFLINPADSLEAQVMVPLTRISLVTGGM